MIRVVTDSTSYIPPDLLKNYNILVAPLKVFFGQEVYDEVVGISNQEFYRRLTTTSEFPTTSQPASGRFKQAYQEILSQEPTAEILVVTISSGLSGTCNSALAAAKQMPEVKITVFDSLSAAMGLGLMVITAAEMARTGCAMAEILTRLEQMRRNTSIILYVDTLEYLKRGGRIGATTAFLGNLLHTKPIVSVTDGKMRPFDRVRGKKKAIERILTELENKLTDKNQPVQAGVMHAAAEAEMRNVAEMVKDRFNLVRLYTSELGPVIGAHLGPGALGVGICLESRL